MAIPSQPLKRVSATLDSHVRVAKSLTSESIIRGFKWAGILIAVTTVPLITASLFFPDFFDRYIHVTLGQSSQIGLGLAALAGGAKIHWVESGVGFDFLVSGSVKLSLLTVLVQATALRHGRKFGKSSPGPIYIPVALTSLGFAVTLFSSMYILRGFEGVYTAPQILDFFRIFLFVAVPMTVGAILRQYPDNASVSGFKKSLTSLRIHSLLVASTTIIGLIVFWLVETIRPDFLYAQPEVDRSYPQHFYLYVLGVILAVVLNLPAVVIGTLSVLTGAALAASIFSTFAMPGFLSDSINEFCDFFNMSCVVTTHSVSDQASLLVLVENFSPQKRATYIAIFLFAIGLFMALSSSFAAKLDSPIEPLRKRVFRNLIAFTVIGGYLIWLINAEFTMSELPTSTNQINVNRGHGSLGLGIGAIFAVAAGFAVIAGFATGEKVKTGLRAAFPRTSRIFRVDGDVQGSGSRGWRVFGRVTTTVVISAVVLSLVGASYELYYAKNNGPKFYGSKLQKVLEDGDVAGFKKITGNPKDLPWLDTKIMTKALPASNASSGIEIKNKLGKEFVTGQLDAIVTYSLGGSKGKVKYDLPMNGKTESLFHVKFDKNHDADYLTKAVYTFDARPVHVSLEAGEFIPTEIIKKLKINDVSTKLGTFNAVPGRYHIVLPGYKLISPTDIYLDTASATASATVGADIVIPEKMNSLMTNRFNAVVKNKCKLKPTKSDFGSTCADTYTIWQKRKKISGTDLENFDTYSFSNVHATKLACNGGSNTLTSASSVKRIYKCSSTISFTLTSDAKAVYEQGDPIYRDVPQYTTERYDACPYEPYICEETREVYIGTSQELVGYKRGPLVTPAKHATGTFSSEVKTNIVVKGTLQNDGQFAIK